MFLIKNTSVFVWDKYKFLPLRQRLTKTNNNYCMRKSYNRLITVAALSVAGLSANAQEGLVAPKGDALENGKEYTMFNCYSPSSYLGRTTWDGALVNFGASADSYLKFHAQQNDGGTWSFYYDSSDEVPVRYYLHVPTGTANVNFKSTEATEWMATAYGDYYRLKVDEGNNAEAMGYNMHMNSSCQYIVASYPGDSWYPDFYGGTKKDEYGDEIFDEDDRLLMADSMSCNWLFVETANVPDYIVKASGYTLLSNFYSFYIKDESYADYATGFKASYDAVLAIYNGEFLEEDVEEVKAMLEQKVALYEQIEKADAIEDKDAVLTSAIENAVSMFNSTTAAAALVSVQETLAEAVKNFELGNGDVTSLGKNMSFEDLSSQNGQTTVGVGAVPAGWHVYINSNEVTTADEVKAAGIANWHGVNGDATGEGKDGSYAYGIWTSSVPSFEISQTIEGLENGSYTVTAGLMVGANGSGSRRTTQRVFGNLNSTYYGLAEEYNEGLLDQSEVYAFQGLEEPVTDTELKLVTVDAYVYDGTLTFGMRTDGNIAAANRTSGNGAGGDGWFKLDNFHITYNGYDADDALSIVSFFTTKLIGILDDSEIILPESVRTHAGTLVSAADELDETSDVEDINESILDLSSNISAITDIADAYTDLIDAITLAWERADDASLYAGIGEFCDSIMAVEEHKDNADYLTVEEIGAAIALLDVYYQRCLESDPIEEGSDLTSYIVNNSFEDLSNQNNTASTGVANAPKGWTLTLNGNVCTTAAEITAVPVENWCAINGGDGINVEFEGETYTHQYTDGNYLWGIWTASMPVVELSQTLTLPEGVYELTCDMMVQSDWAGNNITTQRLFGNSSVQMWARESDYADNLPQDALDAQVLQQYNTVEDVTYYSYAGYDNDASSDYTNLLRPMKLTFVVGADKVAKIGMRTDSKSNGVNASHNGQGWFKVDNFHLTCLKLGAVDSPDLPDGIEEVDDAAASVDGAVYDLTGRKVSAPAKGIYILNGKKVLVK